MEKATILVVDDEPQICNLLTQVLSLAGWNVRSAPNGRLALEEVDAGDIDLIISDIMMPEMDGIELVRRVKEKDPNLEIILVTGRASLESAIASLKAGAFDYILKPFEDISLINIAARRALEHRSMVLEREQLIEQLQNTVEEVNQKNRELVETHLEIMILNGMVEVSGHLIASLEAPEVLRLATSDTRKIMEAQLCTVALVESEGKCLRIREVDADNLDTTVFEGYEEPLSQNNTVFRTAFNSTKPVCVSNLDYDNNLEIPEIIRELGIKSLLCVPLQVRGQAYGVLATYYTDACQHAEKQINLLSLLANQIASALQSAWLYESLREERDKIINAEADVRKELARELHDGMLRSLANISMNAEFVQKLMSRDTQKAYAELKNIQEAALNAARQGRTLLFELRPVILETQGLIAALDSYFERLNEETGPRLYLDRGDFERDLPPKVEKVLFAIVQEAVTNTRKHASAQNLWLNVFEEDERLIIKIKDDGVGFDVEEALRTVDQRPSIGLLNMKERAELIDGQLVFDSEPGAGTVITIIAPLSAATATVGPVVIPSRSPESPQVLDQ